MTTSICEICDRQFSYERVKGHTKTKCTICSINARRFLLKDRYVKYKGGKCEVCGYSKSNRALTFHHLDPTQKEFGISGSHCRKWEDVKAELDKCQLLCMNCHMEEHERLDYREIDKEKIESKLQNAYAFCKSCNLNKKIDSNGICKKCAAPPIIPKDMSKIQWPSKEELEKMVWSTPTSKLALQLGVGDKAIHKRCIKYGITKPGPGYWRKLETGKL